MEKFKISFRDTVEFKYIEKDSFVDIHSNVRLSVNEVASKAIITLDVSSLSSRLCHYVREYITSIINYPNCVSITLTIPKNEIRFDI